LQAILYSEKEKACGHGTLLNRLLNMLADVGVKVLC